MKDKEYTYTEIESLLERAKDITKEEIIDVFYRTLIMDRNINNQKEAYEIFKSKRKPVQAFEIIAMMAYVKHHILDSIEEKKEVKE